MITTLLIISLLLHGVTLIWVSKNNQSSHVSKEELEHTKREIEDLLISYTAEIKEENERLLTMMNSQTETKDTDTLENTTNTNVVIDQVNSESYPDYQPPIIQEEEVTFEQSIQAQLIFLQQQGLTIEQIAKKLNKGTGEVELMLKFQKMTE